MPEIAATQTAADMTYAKPHEFLPTGGSNRRAARMQAAALRWLVRMAALLTAAVLVFLIGYILVMGIPNLKPELFAWEYYSEDGFLSGMMSAYEVKAIQDKGVHVVMKHFALNDCEQDRIGLGVWINEQAAREVYLKAFQAPVEVGNANGVMIAYTRWGAVWSGGNYGLVTGILRNEWGCDGMVITDNVLTQYVNGPDGVMAGVSIYDAMMSFVTDTLPKYKNDAVIVNAMREACHHNLYAIANSCGMNGVGANTTIKVTRPTVVTMSIIIACASTFFCLLGIVMWIIGGIKFRKTEEYKAYKDFKKSLKAAKKA